DREALLGLALDLRYFRRLGRVAFYVQDGSRLADASDPLRTSFDTMDLETIHVNPYRIDESASAEVRSSYEERAGEARLVASAPIQVQGVTYGHVVFEQIIGVEMALRMKKRLGVDVAIGMGRLAATTLPAKGLDELWYTP